MNDVETRVHDLLDRAGRDVEVTPDVADVRARAVGIRSVATPGDRRPRSLGLLAAAAALLVAAALGVAVATAGGGEGDGVTSEGTATTAAPASSVPTKGTIPPGPIDEATLPDFVALSEVPGGYIAKEDLLHPWGQPEALPLEDDGSFPPPPVTGGRDIPVYGEDLETVIGHLTADGYRPVG